MPVPPPTNQAIQGPLQIPGASIFPDGGQIFYVGTPLPSGVIPTWITNRIFSTVEAALGQCVSGRGDTIAILPGTAISIDEADDWSELAATDVTVIGLGNGTNRPTLTWTAAAATLLMDQANFRLRNLRLFLAGPHAAGSALTVAAPITVSAAGCEISDCDIFWGFDADQIVTIGITTTAAADHFKFNRNFCYAETAAVPTTTFIRFVGSDYLQIWDTKIQGPGSATTLAPVQFLTTASLGMDLRNSIFQNQLAASVHAVTGLANLTGTCNYCSFGILDNATAVGFVTPGNIQLIGCQTSNDNGVGSAVVPA